MLEYLPTDLVVLICGLMGLIGLILGSGLNCLAMRLAAGKKWSGNERSACPHCGHTLGAFELIPLISWLIQGGKCRHCASPISIRYPLTEATLALVYVALLFKFGFTMQLITPVIFASCLFCLSLVDFDTQIIPDRFHVIPIIARFTELLLIGGIRGLLTGIIPGLIIAGSVLAISLVMDKILKKDTMGGGDIKLLFVIGCFLSLPECLLMVMIACIVGIVMASILMKLDSETQFPFGPALSIAAIVSRYLYKMSGNIWTPAVLNAVLMTVMTVANTMVCYR